MTLDVTEALSNKITKTKSGMLNWTCSRNGTRHAIEWDVRPMLGRLLHTTWNHTPHISDWLIQLLNRALRRRSWSGSTTSELRSMEINDAATLKQVGRCGSAGSSLVWWQCGQDLAAYLESRPRWLKPWASGVLTRAADTDQCLSILTVPGSLSAINVHRSHVWYKRHMIHSAIRDTSTTYQSRTTGLKWLG